MAKVHFECNVIELHLNHLEQAPCLSILRFKQQNAIKIDLGLLHLAHELIALTAPKKNLHFELVVCLERLRLVLEVLD